MLIRLGLAKGHSQFILFEYLWSRDREVVRLAIPTFADKCIRKMEIGFRIRFFLITRLQPAATYLHSNPLRHCCTAEALNSKVRSYPAALERKAATPHRHHHRHIAARKSCPSSAAASLSRSFLPSPSATRSAAAPSPASSTSAVGLPQPTPPS